MGIKHTITWNENKKSIILLLIFVSTVCIVGTTPVHEGCHWMMSEVDPYIEPVEMHLFDNVQIVSNDHVLFSSLGYVIVKEEYPGAFQERPYVWDEIQEFVCVFLQILIAIFVSLEILLYVLKDKNITKSFS